MLFLTLWLILGLLLLFKGADWLVNGASVLAKKYNVSDLAIGLTIVVFGTSAPELATSVVASFRKNVDIAVGNIIGSNIFNIFLILAISAFVKPVTFNATFNSELYLLGAGNVFLFVAMFTGGKQLYY